ncbi:MAG: ferrous iron transport protein B [Pedosphaera sp.]|nr:ferrous iron transport protein B [Pedosphaera sp.]
MKPFTVVLTGNPNCGKTTLFNALTGLRGRVGNYAGVTVERKEGSLTGADARFPVTILDLPGTYSLSPQSPDEQIARDILFQRVADVPAPDLVVVVVDASNLQRNLYFATQVIELGHPTLLTLNMVDVARDQGHDIDTDALSKALGVPVIPMVASQGEGLEPLRQSIRSQASSPGTRHVIPRDFNELPEAFGREAQAIETALERHFPHRSRLAAAEALLLLSDERALPTDKTNTDGNTNGNTANTRYPSALIEQVLSARRRLEAAGVDWRSTAIEARYARLFAIEQHVTRETPPPGELLSDRIDRSVTHRIWGPLIFVTVMALMFQSIFWLAKYPMDGIEAAVDALAQWVGSSMPPGDLNDLITRGAIAGVGSVVIFLPQICLLFLFIGLLEDTGYMSRAAFLMDRLMSRVGLHGKSFIPMLSSFACAIPGIMATRTIETRQDRLATILVAPLMSCSARLPVYTVLIAACIPQRNGWPGLTLLMMYLLGIAGALGMAWVFKKTLLRGEPPMLILELPPYKRPMLGAVLRQMWDRSKLFLKRAGTVILGINILLWFLATYPRSSELQQQFDQRHAQWKQAASNPPTSAESETLKRLDQEEAGEKLRQSFAGRLGRAIEPALKPLGFDWKIGIGIVTSFAAREVFVSTLSVVYNVGGDSENTASLAEVMKSERRDDGRKTYTPLTGLTLMVFYVFAMQCVSTVAVVRRETNSWKWPLFQTVYMTSLAWILAFLTYQVGTRLGF